MPNLFTLKPLSLIMALSLLSACSQINQNLATSLSQNPILESKNSVTYESDGDLTMPPLNNEEKTDTDSKEPLEAEANEDTGSDNEDAWEYKGDRFDNRMIVQKNGLFGFIDYFSEELIIPNQYTCAMDFSERLAGVRKDDKWGFIDQQGKEVIPFVYDNAYSFSDGIAHVEKDGKHYYIDKQLNKIFDLPEGYEEAYGFTEGLASISKDGKVGVINKQGEIILKPTYDQIEYFQEGVAVVENNDKYGVIDSTGKLIVPVIYDGIEYFNDGVAKVTQITDKGDKYGVLDLSGKLIIPIDYDYVGGVQDDIIVVKKDDKYGAYTRTGKRVIPLQYQELRAARNGVLIAKNFAQADNPAKYGYLTTNGDLLLPFRYDEADYFYTGYSDTQWAEVTIDGKKFKIDRTGKQSPMWDYEGIEEEGRIKVRQGDKYGYIDKARNLVIPIIYDWVNRFEGEYARVCTEGRCGVIDKSGNIIIPIIYDKVGTLYDGVVVLDIQNNKVLLDKRGHIIHRYVYDYDFIDRYYHGFASARKNGRWGVIDKQENVLLPFQYDFIQRYVDGSFALLDKQDDTNKISIANLAGQIVITPDMGYNVPYIQEGRIAVFKKNKGGFADMQGNIVIPLVYDNLYPFDQGAAMVKQGDKWGMIDKMGNQIVDFIYDDAQVSLEGLTAVKQGVGKQGKWGFINARGDVVIAFEYDSAIGFVNGEAMVEKDGQTYRIDRSGNKLS